MSELTKGKHFCVLPWIHLNTTTGGLYRYCCLMPDAAKSESGVPFTLEENSPLEVWNSPEMKQMRGSLLKGQPYAGCKKCYSEERDGARSLRQDYNEIWMAAEGREIESRVAESFERMGALTSAPSFVELKFGNLCNLKCRMCSPFDSSQIQKEYEELANAHPEFDSLWKHRHQVLGFAAKKLADVKPWYESPERWQQFLATVPHLRKVHFAGGEPTLHEQFYQFLQHCVDSGDSSHIELSFNTNLTTVQERWVGLLPRFKSAVVHASIDGVGPLQEYIRYPSEWGKIDANLRKVNTLGGSVRVVVSPTVQIYNVEFLPEMFEYVDSVHGRREGEAGSIPVTPGLLYHPQYLSITNLPVPYKNAIADKLQTYQQNCSWSWRKQRVQTFINVLQQPMDPALAKSMLHKFSAFTSILDQKRKQKFADVLPRLARVIEDGLHGG